MALFLDVRSPGNRMQAQLSSGRVCCSEGIGKIEANGELFKHMRDPSAP
jgi:hypothetical protein